MPLASHIGEIHIELEEEQENLLEVYGFSDIDYEIQKFQRCCRFPVVCNIELIMGLVVTLQSTTFAFYNYNPGIIAPELIFYQRIGLAVTCFLNATYFLYMRWKSNRKNK
jgi:hypothetical protein